MDQVLLDWGHHPALCFKHSFSLPRSSGLLTGQCPLSVTATRKSDRVRSRQWPWVQLCTHLCVVLTYSAYWHLVDPCSCDQTMIMKMHSYMTMNRYLQYASQQSAETMTQLCDATVCVGGWEKAIYDDARTLTRDRYGRHQYWREPLAV